MIRFALCFLGVALSSLLLQIAFFMGGEALLGYSPLILFGPEMSMLIENNGLIYPISILSIAHALSISAWTWKAAWATANHRNHIISLVIILLVSIFLTFFFLGVMVAHAIKTIWDTGNYDIFEVVFKGGLWGVKRGCETLLQHRFYSMIFLFFATLYSMAWLRLLAYWQRKYNPITPMQDDYSEHLIKRD